MFRTAIRATLKNSKVVELRNQVRCLSNTSTDIKEVNKFDKFSILSEYNWYTSELTRPLRNLNKLRVPLVKNQLTSSKLYNKEKINEHEPLGNIDLLDVGCGGGLMSECLARLGANVTAIDANEYNIQFAKDHQSKLNITNRLNYVHSDLDTFATNDGRQFDAIVASEILEHVNSVDKFVRNCSKLLRDDGLLFVTTINQTAQSYLFAILLAENVFNLAPKNTHQYNKLVLLNGLSLILEESKCSRCCCFELASCVVFT